MVTELAFTHLDAHAAAFAGAHTELVIAAIREGNTAGQLWQVAQADAPPALLLWDKGNNVCYLAGELRSEDVELELAELLSTSIRPQAIEQRLTHFKVRALSASVEAALPTLFADVTLRELHTLFYSFTAAQPNTVPPPGVEHVQIMPIDRALLMREDLQNLEPVRSEIRWMWPSEERFYQHGFGSLALVGPRAICWCTAEYRSARRCGVGIETDPTYERHGVATATAAHFVQGCMQRGVTPFWECRSNNLPSIRVAEKIGFERLAEERYWVGVFE